MALYRNVTVFKVKGSSREFPNKKRKYNKIIRSFEIEVSFVKKKFY